MGSTRPLAGAAPFSLAAIVVVLIGCGRYGGGADQTSAGSSAGSAQAVTIRDYAYEPARIVVPEGTTVRFTNADSTPHTATSKQAGGFESGSIGTGKSGSVTLDQAGTFAYYCVFHPFMKGTIVVE